MRTQIGKRTGQFNWQPAVKLVQQAGFLRTFRSIRSRWENHLRDLPEFADIKSRLVKYPTRDKRPTQVGVSLKRDSHRTLLQQDRESMLGQVFEQLLLDEDLHPAANPTGERRDLGLSMLPIAQSLRLTEEARPKPQQRFPGPDDLLKYAGC
jgi:hypothetical protein